MVSWTVNPPKLGRFGDLLFQPFPDLLRCAEAVPTDAPLPVVDLLEGQEPQAQVLDRLETTNPELVFGSLTFTVEIPRSEARRWVLLSGRSW